MREMDEYAFNLKPLERKDIRDSMILCFLLATGWLTWVILRGIAHGFPVLFWIVTAGLLCIVYSTALRSNLLFSPDPVLRLTQTGVEDFQFGFGLIPWEEILEIQPRLPIHPIRRGLSLDLSVRHPTKFIRRVPFYRWMKFPVKTLQEGILVIPFEELDGDMGDAVDWIRSYHPDVYLREPIKG